MTKPIAPDDVALAKTATIPDAVFAVFNALIVTSWNGRCARVLQRDVVAEVQREHPDLAPQLFTRGWMDVEDSYRAAGWSVSYDKPAYNETYEASYTFARSKP